jgi:hypothetical protein
MPTEDGVVGKATRHVKTDFTAIKNDFRSGAKLQVK